MTRNTLLLASALLPLGLLFGCGKAPAPETPASSTPPAMSPEAHPTYTAAQFYQTTSLVMPSNGPYAYASDNRSVLIGSDQSGVFNAYRLDTVTGEQVPLTDSTDSPIYPLSWFPEDDRFLFNQDGNGDELDHIFVQTPQGEVLDLTPGDGLKADWVGWAGDGEAFFISSNERDSSAFDVYRYQTADYRRERVFENTGNFGLGGVSPDGRWMALLKEDSNVNNNLFLVDLRAESPEPVLISEHVGDITYEVFGFTPDSSRLIFGTDEGEEFVQAWAHDIAEGTAERLISANWDIQYVLHSPSGRYRVTGTNADASTVVEIVDLSRGEALDLSALPAGDVRNVRFNRDETAITFGIDADTSPTDLYVMALKDPTPKRLTHALNPQIDQAALVDGEVVRFASYDGIEVPGILYRPKTASAANPVPAIVLVHGGPGGQSRKGYNAMRQHLVNHGYAVYAINNRGSSGYGRTFYHLDDRRHGEADLADVVASKDFLAAYDWIDGERIGIMGGSYGGYMVAAALAFAPEVFDVGINIFGVTNWLRTLESIPPWWGSFRDRLYTELGDPAVDGDRLHKISPLFHAENIVKPLLVVQGANDPRVLQVESDELVEKAKANGVPVEYVLFADEGHGFSKRENRITAQEAYLRFLQAHL